MYASWWNLKYENKVKANTITIETVYTSACLQSMYRLKQWKCMQPSQANSNIPSPKTKHKKGTFKMNKMHKYAQMHSTKL